MIGDDDHFRMLTALKTSLKKLTGSRSTFNEIVRIHTLNGTFRKLCDSAQLSEILFPGTTQDVLRNMPTTFRDVLMWSELEIDVVKITRNAAEVLRNIKVKGAKRGDIMDEFTEEALMPQIAQEALANGVVEAVRALNRKISSTTAQLSLNVASPESPKAALDQLDNSLIADLYHQDVACAVQPHFMGDEWAGVIAADMARFCQDESMTLISSAGSALTNNGGGGDQKQHAASSVLSPSSSSPSTSSSLLTRMAWIEPGGAVAGKYPALEELLTQMHALPYELNAKADGISPLVLLEPSRGCTMLLHHTAGSTQLPRIDSRCDGGPLDSGIRMTCSYHLICARGDVEAQPLGSDSQTAESPTDGSFVLTNERSNTRMSLGIEDDWLVLHQSGAVRNERTAVQAGREYFVLAFFVHGRQRQQSAES